MKWTFGEEVIIVGITFALLLQFIAVSYAMFVELGWKRINSIFVIVTIATWLIEYIGSTTGIPFGVYHYTAALQPQLGNVPLLIPFAWFMMLPTAWTIAELITGRKNTVGYLIVSGLAMTAWDLFLDPLMVGWGFWQWQVEGGYFGIPWSNYLGWFVSATAVTFIIRPYRFDMPRMPLLAIYGIIWFLQTFGQAFFWDQLGPALIGGLLMGLLLIVSGHQYWRQTKRAA